jgi:hypothetical protein
MMRGTRGHSDRNSFASTALDKPDITSCSLSISQGIHQSLVSVNSARPAEGRARTVLANGNSVNDSLMDAAEVVVKELPFMRQFVTTTIGLFMFFAAIAQAEPVSIPKSTSTKPMLKSIYAGVHSLSDFQTPDTKATVLIFLGLECPVSKQYIPRLQSLHNEFRSQHIQFLALFPDAGVDLFRMATFGHDNDIPFPVLQDYEHRLADVLEVTVVPEVVVLDAKMEKRYQGAIDDQFKKRGRLPTPTRPYLKNAITQLLAGQEIEVPTSTASGCPVERNSPMPATKGHTYHKDIAPLVQKNCQPCHRPQGVAPFQLLTYDDVSDNVEKIKEVISERRMPPWHGILNSQFGQLRNDKRLSEEEINKMLGWIDEGAPPGNPQDEPPPIRWPDPTEWAIGKPDYVYKIEPFRVPKTGVLDYQFFRVKLDLPEDRWFQAVEVRPGSPDVVHHIVLHIVPAGDRKFTGFAGMAALYGVNAERARLINDYIPGDTYNAKTYPADQAVRIPKNTDLIYEIHYTPNNRAETTDQSMVAFKWAPQPPREEVMATVFRKPIGRFRIPAHHSHYRIEDTYFFPHDVELDAVRPHFHLRGKSYRLEMIERNPKTDEIEKRTTILSVPIYDPNWQRSYELATPLRIPAGTELLATGYFDNSDLNPNNPDPSAVVEWGQQINDEMFSTRFKYRVVEGSRQ